jgi:septal ring factor EnvC (AmiA/AmiB activator)
VTQTERELQKLNQAIALHELRSIEVQADIEDLSKELEKLEAILDKNRDHVADLRSLVAVQTALLDDFKKRWEESDRRRWTIYGVMLAAALTFIANLVLLLLRK